MLAGTIISWNLWLVEEILKAKDMLIPIVFLFTMDIKANQVFDFDMMRTLGGKGLKHKEVLVSKI